MKTFVTDDYQITVRDDGGFAISFYRIFTPETHIGYSPNNGGHWVIEEPKYDGKTIVRTSQNLGGLGLLKLGYETLREVLEVVGKQDLVDNEIVFVDKRGTK